VPVRIVVLKVGLGVFGDSLPVRFKAFVDPFVGNAASGKRFQARPCVVDSPQTAVRHQQGVSPEIGNKVDHVLFGIDGHQKAPGPFDQADVTYFFHALKRGIDALPVDRAPIRGDVGCRRKAHLYGDHIVNAQMTGLRIERMQGFKQQRSIQRSLLSTGFDGFDAADGVSHCGKCRHQADCRISFTYFSIGRGNKDAFRHMAPN